MSLVLLTTLLAVYFYKSVETEHVHYHAGFKVYIDGQLQDYSDFKYMNFVACSEHDEKKSKEEEQIEKAHLHDGVADVVHTHRNGAVWGDLFKNIKVQLPQDKQLRGYINGEEVKDIMSQPITAYSTAVFLVGENEEDQSKGVVSLERIKEVEAKSELCGDGK
jgi:hypothetical protein